MAKGLGLCATFLVSAAWSALNSEYERINTSLNIPRRAGRGRYFTPVNHHHHNKVSKRASSYHYLSLRQTFVSKCVVSCFSQAFPATSVNENAKYDQEGCRPLPKLPFQNVRCAILSHTRSHAQHAQHARTDKDPLHTHARTRNTCASARTEVHACIAHRPNTDPHTCFWS